MRLRAAVVGSAAIEFVLFPGMVRIGIAIAVANVSPGDYAAPAGGIAPVAGQS